MKSNEPPAEVVLMKTGDQLVRFVETSMMQMRSAPARDPELKVQGAWAGERRELDRRTEGFAEIQAAAGDTLSGQRGQRVGGDQDASDDLLVRFRGILRERHGANAADIRCGEGGSGIGGVKAIRCHEC